MSTRSSAPRGVLLAGVGAFVALGSLWLPWYTIRFPDSFKDALSGIGSAGAGSGGTGSTGAGAAGEAFAGLFKGLAAVLPSEITGKGWQVMSGGDVALAVAAGAALLLVLAVSGGASGVRIDRGIAGRLISVAGLVVAGIALYHVVSKPGAGAGELSEIVQVKLGIWVATAGGLAMIVGGALTSRPPRAEAIELTPAAPALPAEGVTGDAPSSGAAFSPPQAASVRDPFAAPAPVDPFAAPVADPPAQIAAPDPFAAPAETRADPDREPEPYPAFTPLAAAAPDPFASAIPAPGTAGPDAEAVPDWAGFSTPTPSQEPEPGFAESEHRSPTPTTARPAGVSIPPPGWSGAG